MLEMALLGAVITVFKAAFAGDDLDRKVGADVMSTVLNGLVRTSSPTDPVLLQVRDLLEREAIAPYERAMDSGHRYLEEAQHNPARRAERLALARERLVDAASAASRPVRIPALVANAELAVAKCDALLGEPLDVDTALRRAAGAAEEAIQELDTSASALTNLRDARFRQDESVGVLLSNVLERNVTTKADLARAESAARAAIATLGTLTDLYSEIQTATLTAAGGGTPVIWAPPPEAERTLSAGRWGKAVAVLDPPGLTCGFGLTVQAERVLVWRPDDEIVADVLLRLTSRSDLWVNGTVPAAAEAARVDGEAAAIRAASPAPDLVPPGTREFAVPPGTYRGWWRLPVRYSADEVHLELMRNVDGRRLALGGTIRIRVARPLVRFTSRLIR